MTSILVIIGRIYHYRFKCNYLKNQRHFAAFLLHFRMYIKLWTFWKKSEPQSLFYVFMKFLTLKDVVTKTCKRSCFWKPFGSQRVNDSSKLLKSAVKQFCPIFSSLRVKFSLKKSFLVRSELGLLVNMLTADSEYSRHNSENLTLPIQRQLSRKTKTFLESTLNFEHFEKKCNLIA